MSELIFLIEKESEEAYTAKALGESIFAEADTMDELKLKIKDVVRCHFEENELPAIMYRSPA